MFRRMPIILSAAAVLLCLFTVAASARAAPSNVLETFRDGPYTWQLAVAPGVAAQGGGKEFPLIVTLLHNKQKKGSATLPTPAAVEKFEREPADEPWAVVGLDAEPGLQAWGSGLEESYLGVTARLVPLGGGRQGLLVSEIWGFSHLHRAHVLYMAVDGSLKEVWSFTESGSPQSSSIRPVMANARPYLLFWRNLYGYEENMPDTRTAVLLGLRENSTEIETVPLPAPGVNLTLVVAGFYDTVPQALKAAKGMACPDWPTLWILPADIHPQAVERGGAVLGNIFFSPDEALEFYNNLDHCAPRPVHKTLVVLKAPADDSAGTSPEPDAGGGELRSP